MGPEETNDGKLYAVNGMTSIVWPGLQSCTLTTFNEPEIIDQYCYCDHLPFIEGTMTFTLKDPYISRKLARPVRRWCRKKEQQRKRKIAKEKKHGLLHEEA